MLFERLRKHRKIGDAVGRHGDDRRGLAIEQAARKHRGMLDRRQIAVPGGIAQRRGERQRIGFGAAAGKDHVRRASPPTRAATLALALSIAARAGAPFRMHRGRIAHAMRARRSPPRALRAAKAPSRYSRDRSAGSSCAEARGRTPPVNACTSPRRTCYEARPDKWTAPSAQLIWNGLVWNNSKSRFGIGFRGGRVKFCGIGWCAQFRRPI